VQSLSPLLSEKGANLLTAQQSVSTLCSEKTILLEEYVASLDLHSKDVREYSELIRAGVDGESLEIVRRRMQESREQTASARKQYAAHLDEHRCDSPT